MLKVFAGMLVLTFSLGSMAMEALYDGGGGSLKVRRETTTKQESLHKDKLVGSECYNYQGNTCTSASYQGCGAEDDNALVENCYLYQLDGGREANKKLTLKEYIRKVERVHLRK
jgi:hypothetical protein